MRTGFAFNNKRLFVNRVLSGAASLMFVFVLPGYTYAADEITLNVDPVFVGESITIEEEPIVEFEGTTTETDNYHEYSYTAPNGGNYRIEQKNLTPNTNMDNYVVDELGNDICELWGTTSKTVTLDKGATYTIKVPQYFHDNNKYKITIKAQKPSTDITQITEINDQISFIDQKNIYFYTAPINGYYRFDIDNTAANTKFGMFIWDSNGTNILKKNSGTSGEQVYLEQGETYQIQIRYWLTLGKYTLHVYAQKEKMEISGYTDIEDSIEFSSQDNFYDFSCVSDGEYTFNLENVKPGNEFNLYLWDESGDSLKTSKSIWLNAGETYTVSVQQKKGKGNYSLKIGYPQEALHEYSPVSKDNTEAAPEAEEGFAANEDTAKLLEENQQLRAELEELQAKYDLLVQIIGDSGVEISDEE